MNTLCSTTLPSLFQLSLDHSVSHAGPISAYSYYNSVCPALSNEVAVPLIDHPTSINLRVLASIQKDLALIASLKNGWHGDASVQVGPIVLQRTEDAANSIAQVEGLPAPDVTPNPHGTVSLEWEIGSTTIYLEIGTTRSTGFVEIAGHDLAVLQVQDLNTSFFRGIKELISPSKGPSFSLPESQLIEYAPMAA